METAAGRWRLACSMSNSTLFPAASPTMRTLPGRSSATLRVLTPMEPVLPRRTTDLIWDLRFTIYDLRILGFTGGFRREATTIDRSSLPSAIRLSGCPDRNDSRRAIERDVRKSHRREDRKS